MLARRYHLQRVLGRGAMGAVWEAEDTVLRRTVAVKEVVLPGGLSPEERAVSCERTLREARAIARLGHPNVVTLFDVLDEDARPWVVMEMVPSRSLADVIKEDGPLHPLRVATVGLAILGALEAAHAAGITHRDVKPGNILLGHDGRVKLTDFGIARAAGDDTITGTGLLVGSPSYIAPEIVKGQGTGPAADLWGLGATLYAAVEGRAPFSGGDAMDTLSKVVQDPPAPYERAGALMPALGAMLEKDPGRRASPVEARRLLLDVLRGGADAEQPAPARPAPPAAPAPAPGATLGPALADLLVPVNRRPGDPNAGFPPPGGGVVGSAGLAAAGARSSAPPAPAGPAPAASAAVSAPAPAPVAEPVAEPVAGPIAEPAEAPAGEPWSLDDEPEIDPGDEVGADSGATEAVEPVADPGPPVAFEPAGPTTLLDPVRSDAGSTSAFEPVPAGATSAFEPVGDAPAEAGPTAAFEPVEAPAASPPTREPEVRPSFFEPAERPADRAADRAAEPAEELRTELFTHGGGQPHDPDEPTQVVAPLPFGGPREQQRPAPRPPAWAPAPGGGGGRGGDGGGPLGFSGERPREERRKRNAAALVAVVALVLVAVLGAYLLVRGIRDGSSGQGAGGTPTSSPSAAQSDAAVPSGYRRYQGDGFSIAVPADWKAEEGRNGVVDIKEPGTSRFLRLITVGGSGSSALAQLRAAEDQFSANDAYKPYERIKLGDVDYRDYDAADWEFTFELQGQERHVVYRGVATGGRSYGIYLSSLESTWSESAEVLKVAFDTFRPGG